MLALVDGQYKFRWVDVGTAGSCSDAQIFNTCHLKRKIDDGSIGFPDPAPTTQGVWYWVCLFVGWWLCDNIISFNPRDGVSVGLFYYRFKPTPWILSYKWADYWQYWEFIYLFFFYVAFCCYVYYHGLFVSCLGRCGCWAFFCGFVL